MNPEENCVLLTPYESGTEKRLSLGRMGVTREGSRSLIIKAVHHRGIPKVFTEFFPVGNTAQLCFALSVGPFPRASSPV
jgi:hypothetical protein